MHESSDNHGCAGRNGQLSYYSDLFDDGRREYIAEEAISGSRRYEGNLANRHQKFHLVVRRHRVDERLSFVNEFLTSRSHTEFGRILTL